MYETMNDERFTMNDDDENEVEEVGKDKNSD